MIIAQITAYRQLTDHSQQVIAYRSQLTDHSVHSQLIGLYFTGHRMQITAYRSQLINHRLQITALQVTVYIDHNLQITAAIQVTATALQHHSTTAVLLIRSE
jgi:hypothetical protein